MHNDNNTKAFNKIDMPFFTTYIVQFTYIVVIRMKLMQGLLWSVLYILYNTSIMLCWRSLNDEYLRYHYIILTCITLEYIIQYLYMGQYIHS